MRHKFCFTNILVECMLKVPNPLRPHGLWPTRLLCPWDYSGKNTGVGCHGVGSISWDVPDPGIEPMSLVSPVLAGRFFTTSTIWEVCV